MKSINIIKSVDQLGRFKIPKELLISLDIKSNTFLKIYKKANAIVLQKRIDNCIFCGSNKNIHKFCDKFICNECIDAIKRAST